MAVFTQQQVSSEPTLYEVLYPSTGEVLAFLTLSPDTSASSLAQALESNGFCLVPLDPDLPASLLALHAS